MEEKREKNYRLINMEDVQAREVSWLWYPYIPYGKLTIVQGDPGEGKTTFILHLAALLTKGEPLPNEEVDVQREPVNVIYQNAEDSLEDTIKPRLLEAGADCNRVLVIDESVDCLSMTDERLVRAIRETGAKMVVLDPIQAYLGADVDMHRANEIRPVLKQLGNIAEEYGCAIILMDILLRTAMPCNVVVFNDLEYVAFVSDCIMCRRSRIFTRPVFRKIQRC